MSAAARLHHHPLWCDPSCHELTHQDSWHRSLPVVVEDIEVTVERDGDETVVVLTAHDPVRAMTPARACKLALALILASDQAERQR